MNPEAEALKLVNGWSAEKSEDDEQVWSRDKAAEEVMDTRARGDERGDELCYDIERLGKRMRRIEKGLVAVMRCVALVRTSTERKPDISTVTSFLAEIQKEDDAERACNEYWGGEDPDPQIL